VSPNLKSNENNQPNQGNGQPFFNPWGMFPSPPPMNDPNSQQPKQQPKQQPNHQFNQQPQQQPQYQPRQQPQYQPKQQPQYQPKQQPNQRHDAEPQQPFNPWHVFSGLRPTFPPDDAAPKESKYPNQPESRQPKQSKQHEQAPNQMPFNPWSVLPAFQPYQPTSQEQPEKKKKVNPKGLSVQVVQDNVGKVINTSIVGYGRINVHVKGVERNGMVHLVLLDTNPNDYIYIHNSDMVGIYPPTF